jgi:hypothetical protein
MIGGKMVGPELALMIADLKRVSQVFGRFKSTDMLDISWIRNVTPHARPSGCRLKEFVLHSSSQAELTSLCVPLNRAV